MRSMVEGLARRRTTLPESQLAERDALPAPAGLLRGLDQRRLQFLGVEAILVDLAVAQVLLAERISGAEAHLHFLAAEGARRERQLGHAGPPFDLIFLVDRA